MMVDPSLLILLEDDEEFVTAVRELLPWLPCSGHLALQGDWRGYMPSPWPLPLPGRYDKPRECQAVNKPLLRLGNIQLVYADRLCRIAVGLRAPAFAFPFPFI